ncbi:hypothetical protein [Flavihumibacter sp.]|uniref:hypothetical protein n=1 Tax=Flavihumibacter sp. TaxID=1913981 RepID=UPI002FCB1BCB|nr:hypothetical protein [Flavihumibacter sediminis]
MKKAIFLALPAMLMMGVFTLTGCGERADKKVEVNSGLSAQDSLNAAKYAQPASDYPQRNTLSKTGTGPDSLHTVTDSSSKSVDSVRKPRN